MTEIEAFLQESKDFQAMESRILGYIFEINQETDDFTIGRVEQAKCVELMRVELKILIGDEKVTTMSIDKTANKIFFGMSNGMICELRASV